MSGLRSARLVGRDAEMEQLRRAVEDVRGGDPTLLLVEGEAGIGKTRLVTEAIAQLGAPTDLAATGGGFALGGDEIPFVAASGVLRALVGGLGPDAVLQAGGPALGVLAPGLTGGSHEHARGEVLAAFAGMVEHLAQDRMLWLVFEDLHWVDSSSRELIAYLVTTLGPCRVLMICTRRTHDQPPGPQLLDFVAELVRHPRGQRMTLDRLTAAEVAEQVADLVGGAPEPGFVEDVSARSQGNPFLTEELVGAARDGHSVSDLMLSRVQGLDADARRVVEAAAVGDGHAGALAAGAGERASRPQVLLGPRVGHGCGGARGRPERRPLRVPSRPAARGGGQGTAPGRAEAVAPTLGRGAGGRRGAARGRPGPDRGRAALVRDRRRAPGVRRRCEGRERGVGDACLGGAGAVVPAAGRPVVRGSREGSRVGEREGRLRVDRDRGADTERGLGRAARARRAGAGAARGDE